MSINKSKILIFFFLANLTSCFSCDTIDCQTKNQTVNVYLYCAGWGVAEHDWAKGIEFKKLIVFCWNKQQQCCEIQQTKTLNIFNILNLRILRNWHET